MISGFS